MQELLKLLSLGQYGVVVRRANTSRTKVFFYVASSDWIGPLKDAEPQVIGQGMETGCLPTAHRTSHQEHRVSGCGGKCKLQPLM